MAKNFGGITQWMRYVPSEVQSVATESVSIDAP